LGAIPVAIRCDSSSLAHQVPIVSGTFRDILLNKFGKFELGVVGAIAPINQPAKSSPKQQGLMK